MDIIVEVLLDALIMGACGVIVIATITAAISFFD